MTEYRSEETFGVFVFAGYSPATEALKGVVELNEQGYIVTDGAQKTRAEGVYAAGDVCIKPLRQVVTATGDGALAATELEKYVAQAHRKTGLRALAPVARQREAEGAAVQAPDDHGLFTPQMRQQLDGVFARMQRPLLLKLYLDSRSISAELEGFIRDLVGLSDKLEMQISDTQLPDAPCVEVCLEDGTPTGLAFHGVPSGHEFTSFVLGLYNAAGPGQSLDEDTKQQIAAIREKTDMKILVTLSCTMCPELVVAAQQIAAHNPHISAHVYDIRHFEDLKNQYKVMSVPCLVYGQDKITFGKKNIQQLLDLLTHNL